MTADKAYNFLKFILRKNQTAGLSPDEFAFAFNSGQREYFDLLTGKIEQYQYGKAVPRIALSMTEKITYFLSPFKISKESRTVTSQAATKPTSFNTIISISDVGGNNVPKIDDTRLSARINSVIDPTDTAHPFVEETNSGWKVYPDFTPIFVSYYRLPVDVVYGYTFDGSGRPVYNSGNSTHPEWNDIACEKILARAAEILGYSLQEERLVQYANEVKTGQA